MKNPYAVLLAVLVACFAGLAPSPARANGSPIDCSAGCFIITCSGDRCALWKCDSGGCRLVSTWPRELSDAPLSAGRSTPAKMPADVAYAKICIAGGNCELYQLTFDAAVHVGSFDNVDDVVGTREAGAREATQPKPRLMK